MEKSTFSKRFTNHFNYLLGEKIEREKGSVASRAILVLLPFILIYTILESIFLLFKRKTNNDKE